MPVTIFTMTHKKFDAPPDPIYVPLQVGRACNENLGYMGDDTGDNISDKNCYYGELTGAYWVWKNVKTSGYVGLCHYRRYFCSEEGRIFNEKDYLTILKEYDIITSKKLKLNFSYYDGYAGDYNIADLDAAGVVIRESFPEYYESFERLVHQNGTYFANMLAAKKELYDEYCEWLFAIFDKMEKMIEPGGYDDYHKRVFGFISEFLLLVFVDARKLKAYECKVGMTMEKHETKQMKEALAEYFFKKDIDGAKEYFLQTLQKRPDVMMEASDITGELKTAMQAVAVCSLEREEYGGCVIDRICRFDEIIAYFNRLNDAINNCRFGELKKEDISFIREEKVSAVAIEASARLFCAERPELERIVSRFREIQAVNRDQAGNILP